MFGLFRKNSEAILAARQDQKKQDDEQHRRELNRIDEVHNQQILLQRQGYEAKIRMLENDILKWESREREMTDREYKANMQIKINFEVASTIMKETKAISENVGRFQAIYDKVEIHNDTIKEIGK